MTTLLMSSRHTEDDQALWRAAIRRDWPVVRARGIQVPEINDSEIIIYVEALFAPTIARIVGRELLDPPDDWLVQIPFELKRRNIRLTTLGAARGIVQPTFVKPPNDKSFAAQVYESGDDLPTEFDDDMPVLLSDPVAWDVEYRCFCLDGKVLTLSPYLRNGVLSKTDDYVAPEFEIEAARCFADHVLPQVAAITPRAIVLDVGRLQDGDWAVVEANAAWGSGIYGCAPDQALDVIRHATLQPAR